jgi:hypothetical protein
MEARLSPKTEELKKRGTRFSAGVEAVLHAGGEDLVCRAHNVSRSGALLTGSLPSIQSETVGVTFRLPVGDFSLRLPGRVVRCLDDDENGSVSLGLEFQDLGEEDREGLEVLIARIMEGGHPGPIELLKPGATSQEIRDALEQVPIAHRIALAFRANLREREILLKDTRPPVLEALARNPNLRVDEARELGVARQEPAVGKRRGVADLYRHEQTGSAPARAGDRGRDASRDTPEDRSAAGFAPLDS